MGKLAKAVLGVALLSGVVLAVPSKPVATRETKAQERFEHVKARIINMIDKRISFLENHKACVEKAQNWKELRACRPKRKIWGRPIRGKYTGKSIRKWKKK